MSKTPTLYSPEPGSLADRVMRHLLAHPNDELARPDICQMFNVADRNAVEEALLPAVAAKLLGKTRDAGTPVWHAGENLAAWKAQRQGPRPATTAALRTAPAQAHAPAPAPAERPTRRTNGMPQLPPLDLTVPVQKGVPIPPAVRKGGTKYDAFFDSLTEPDSMKPVPIHYLGALKAASKKYMLRNHTKKLVVRVINSAQAGVWRTQ